MSELMTMPAPDFNEVLVQTVAQNAAHTQALVEQLMALAGGTAKALKASQQAVSLATETKAEVDDLRGRVSDLDRKLQQRITIDGTQKGILYQAVHDRAGWATQNHPEETYQTHIIRIWNKLKRDLVVAQYTYILDKDYDYAMRAALSYPGYGRSWKVA